MKKIIIRAAKDSDISEIHKLVLELARYEEAPDAVTVDLDYYLNEFNKNTFEALVATKDDTIIGMCLYYLTFSTWKGRMVYLEDFVVTEAYRNQGIGQLLFDAFLNEARKMDAKLVKWQVLDWNTPAIKFYEKNQATIEKEWWNGKMIF